MPETATDTDDETTDDEPNLEQHWVAVLAEYWRQADWDQFGNQKKSRADTFGERLEVAVRAGDVHGALQKLARGLGIAVPELPTADLDPLTNNDDRAMRMLRRERVWLVNKADEAVRNFFDALDDADANANADAAEQTTSDLSDFIAIEEREG